MVAASGPLDAVGGCLVTKAKGSKSPKKPSRFPPESPEDLELDQECKSQIEALRANADIRCHWVFPKKGPPCFVPMCSGAAFGSPDDCSCDTLENRLRALSSELGRARRRAKEAESAYDERLQLRGMVTRLSWRVSELRRDALRYQGPRLPAVAPDAVPATFDAPKKEAPALERRRDLCEQLGLFEPLHRTVTPKESQ